MKKLSAFVSVLFLGSALSFAAGCKKDEEKAGDKKEAKKDEKKEGGTKTEEKKDEPKKDEGGGGDLATGSAECDELVKLTVCMAKDVPEAKKAAEDTAKMYKDALAGPGKDATIEGCKTALPQMRDAAKSVGC